MHRHVTALVVVVVEQRQFLLAVGVIVRIIAIQNDDGRGFRVRTYKHIYQTLAQTKEVCPCYRVFQSAHGGLGRQVIVALGQSPRA